MKWWCVYRIPIFSNVADEVGSWIQRLQVNNFIGFFVKKILEYQKSLIPTFDIYFLTKQ